VSTVPLELNPALDVASLAKDYGRKKRLQIRNFLTEQSAQTAYSDLQDLPWGLAYNDGPHVEQLHAEALARLGDR
jgi:hypothetical protein